MGRENRYIEYQGTLYIVIGIGYQSKTPFSDRGDEHYFDCIILSEHNLSRITSMLVGKTIQVYCKDAEEITDRNRVKMLELLYG